MRVYLESWLKLISSIIENGIFAIAFTYCLGLIFIFFQEQEDARFCLTYLDSNLNEPVKFPTYVANCEVNSNEFLNVLVENMDFYVFSHFVSYLCQTMIIRNVQTLILVSLQFELLEYTLEHHLASLSECWWDHWILDFTVFNGSGILLGLYILRFFNIEYYNIPQFWNNPSKSRLKNMLYFVAYLLVLVSNATAQITVFYLEPILWIPYNHRLIMISVAIKLATAFYFSRDCYKSLKSRRKLGKNFYMYIFILIVEMCIIIKFGEDIYQKEIPGNIILAWKTLTGIVGIWVLQKFYFPNWRMSLFNKKDV